MQIIGSIFIVSLNKLSNKHYMAHGMEHLNVYNVSLWYTLQHVPTVVTVAASIFSRDNESVHMTNTYIQQSNILSKA